MSSKGVLTGFSVADFAAFEGGAAPAAAQPQPAPPPPPESKAKSRKAAAAPEPPAGDAPDMVLPDEV